MLIVGVRNSKGARPEGLLGEDFDEDGFRCARRKGPGDSLAKVSAGKDRAEETVGCSVAIEVAGQGRSRSIRALILHS